MGNGVGIISRRRFQELMKILRFITYSRRHSGRCPQSIIFLYAYILIIEKQAMCDKSINLIEINLPPNVEKNKSGNLSSDITRINEPITYNEFFERFMLANKPCIISEFVTKDWPCLKTWVSDNTPNLTYLKNKYGESTVPVADCNERYYNAQKKTTFKLSDYLEYWHKHRTEDSEKVLYLKDWHMRRDYPEAYEYSVPQYFASDWLNEYFSTRKDLNDDYRFVYMGPKDTWTPLHADVYSSYSWSVNVYGRKRWLLFPPGEEECLKDNLGNLAYDAESSELLSNEGQFPHFKNLQYSFEVIQEAGEAIFVPSGWHHQVWNLKHTISINHNWLNGCSILSMWETLKQSLVAVQKEVEDCRDMVGWEQHCQIMLRATYGLNYEEFFGLLKHIGRSRLEMLQDNKPLVQSDNWILGRNHALWDLSRVFVVLNKLLADPDASMMEWVQQDCDTPQKLATDIRNTIKEYPSLWDICLKETT